MSKAEARTKALAVMQELGIDSIAEENPHELPASQRQLVALASVLVTEPKLIVLDEPTKALDARSSDVLAAAIERRLDAGAAVLLVTHDPPFALRMTDRAVGIVDGRVIADGPSAEVFADRSVLERARFVSAVACPGDARRSRTSSPQSPSLQQREIRQSRHDRDDHRERSHSPQKPAGNPAEHESRRRRLSLPPTRDGRRSRAVSPRLSALPR